ncbi:VOC family protein [Nocardia sp. NPDC051570]|uniref:VOC family protein n=1 Tax=Nocardia sp. NPDC051570 TaxID=3364324 RepID=UPI00379496D0
MPSAVPLGRGRTRYAIGTRFLRPGSPGNTLAASTVSGTTRRTILCPTGYRRTSPRPPTIRPHRLPSATCTSNSSPSSSTNTTPPSHSSSTGSGFDLVEDSPAHTTDGRPKRWIVVRPPHAHTGILLARADGDRQTTTVGNQTAGRVGFFLRVDDFDAAHRRMTDRGIEFVTAPRDEPYGRVAVFLDIAGNRWDLLGPAESLPRE